SFAKCALRIFIKRDVVDANDARRVKSVFVHELQRLFDCQGQMHVDSQLATRLPGNFCVRVGVSENRGLGKMGGWRLAEQKQSSCSRVELAFGRVTPEQSARVH